MPSLSLIIKCSLYEHSQIHSRFFCKSESGELSKLFVNTCCVSDAYFAKGSEVEHTNILCHIERLLSTRQRQTFIMYKQDTDYEMEFLPNHRSRVLTDHGDKDGDDDPRGASRRLSAGAKRRLKRQRAVPLALVAFPPQVDQQRQFLCQRLQPPLTRMMQKLRFAVVVVPAALPALVPSLPHLPYGVVPKARRRNRLPPSDLVEDKSDTRMPSSVMARCTEIGI